MVPVRLRTLRPPLRHASVTSLLPVTTLPPRPPEPDADAPIVLDGVTKLFPRTEGRADTIKEGVLSSLSRRTRHDIITALSEVSLSVRRGEVFGLIGSNGAGKSTMLKLMAGITQPTGGRVNVRGRVLGLIELGAGFHPDLTGEENIRLQGSIYGLTHAEIDRRIDAILEFAELADFRHMPVRHYSSGMFVRLGFAIAMHCEPDVLLVDEVLAVGDQSFQERCMREIARRRAGGLTIVFVTHDLAQAERLCDRIAWIDQGRVRAIGGVHDIVAAWYDDLLATRYPRPAARFDDEANRIGLPGRFGSGRARIERLRLLDAEGRVRTHLRRGESLTLEIDYTADPDVEAVDCAVPLVTMDGLLIDYTRMVYRCEPSRPVNGRGTIRLHYGPLPLLAGRYEVSVALSNPADPWDHYDLLYKLFFLNIAPEDDWDTVAPLELSPRTG